MQILQVPYFQQLTYFLDQTVVLESQRIIEENKTTVRLAAKWVQLKILPTVLGINGNLSKQLKAFKKNLKKTLYPTIYDLLCLKKEEEEEEKALQHSDSQLLSLHSHQRRHPPGLGAF